MAHVNDAAMFLALMARLRSEAVVMAWPDQPLQAGEQATLRFMGDVEDPDFTAEVEVHRDGHLVRHRTYAGWDGVAFMIRWVDRAVE